MNAREKLNELRNLWGFHTDNELANHLKIKKSLLDSWVKRGQISKEWTIRIGQMTDECTNIPQLSSAYQLQKLTCKASAGGGNSLDNIEVFNTGEYMSIDRAFFKTPPSPHVKVIQVDGYSMVPVLLPDSWVIFEECEKFKADGLYIVNYGNELMVKLLQMHPNGKLEIVSANKDYKSYEIDLRDNQEHFRIVGKVIRSII